MSDTADRRAALKARIKELEAELREREAALPAHSVRAHQMAEIEDLEDQIAELKKELEGMS